MPISTANVSVARRARRVLVGLLAVVTMAVTLAPASAADDQVALIGFMFIRADEGASVELARIDVEPALVGRTCTLGASVFNQHSVNAGNNVVVSTGGSQFVLADVEAAAGITTSGSATVEAGADVVFTLVMGPAKVFSADLTMTLDCPREPETTTTTTTTTTEKPAFDSTTTTTTTTKAAESSTTSTPTEVDDKTVVVSPAPSPVPGQPSFTG